MTRIGASRFRVVLPSIVILVLIGVLVSVLRRGWEDDLEDDVDDEYQDSLTGTYGAVASAPDMATFGKSIPTLPSGEEREALSRSHPSARTTRGDLLRSP